MITVRQDLLLVNIIICQYFHMPKRFYQCLKVEGVYVLKLIMVRSRKSYEILNGSKL